MGGFIKYSLLALKKFPGESITWVFDNQRNIKRTRGGAMVGYLKDK